MRIPVSQQMQAKRVSRAELATRLFIVVLLAVLLAQAVTIYQIRNTQLEGTPTGRKLVSSADRILDCTDPKGGANSCYQRSQRQTAAILASAQRIILISAACSVDLDAADPVALRVQQVTSCVTERLTAKP